MTNESVKIMHAQEESLLLHGHQATDATHHLQSPASLSKSRFAQSIPVGLKVRQFRILQYFIFDWIQERGVLGQSKRRI